MERVEMLIILKGLRSEFERKSEEIWSRGLEHGYDCSNENGRVSTALEKAIKELEVKSNELL